MEEGVDYVLNDFWFQKVNRDRKECGFEPLKNKQEYRFSRKGDQLFLNNNFVFDFAGKHNLAFTFALTLAFPLTHALQHNGIEKLKPDTCEGKVVKVDGKKYKLTAV